MNFGNCDWGALQVRGTSFESCNFEGARLSHASLDEWYSGLIIEEDPLEALASFEADEGDDPTGHFVYHPGDLDDGLFTHGWSRRTSVSECTLRNADVSESRLVADMYVVDLRSANLRGSLLVGELFAVDFSDSNLVGASFDGNLRQCDFVNANLSRTNFHGATLEAVRFVNANLDGINLEDCRLVDVDFSGVDMTQVDLSRVAYIGDRPE